jgi:hypothetical protein
MVRLGKLMHHTCAVWTAGGMGLNTCYRKYRVKGKKISDWLLAPKLRFIRGMVLLFLRTKET